MSYDANKVRAFVEDARQGTQSGLWNLFHYLTRLSMTTIWDYHNYLQDRFNKLSTWERANVLFELSKDMEEIAREQARQLARKARESE